MDHHAVAPRNGLPRRAEFRLGRTEIHPDQDFGFLLTSEGGLLYFHRNSLLSGDFDALVSGRQLYYVEEVGDTGPLATKARVK